MTNLDPVLLASVFGGAEAPPKPCNENRRLRTPQIAPVPIHPLLPAPAVPVFPCKAPTPTPNATPPASSGGGGGGKPQYQSMR